MLGSKAMSLMLELDERYPSENSIIDQRSTDQKEPVSGQKWD